MSMNRMMAYVGGLAVLAFLTGCPAQPERLSNQGGGTLISAGLKIDGGEMSSLTPDEIQLLADTANQFVQEIDLELSDEQAEAISAFLQSNNLDSVEDFQSLLDNPENVVIPDGAIALFENIDLALAVPAV